MMEDKKQFAIFWSGASEEAKKRSIFWTLFLVVVFCAQVWPVYLIANSVKPLIFGMPFSMFWIALWIVISFVGLILMNKQEQ